MARKKWKPVRTDRVEQAYGLLISKKKPTLSDFDRFRSKLKDPEFYTDFLKLCLDLDPSSDLRNFRKGLLWVIKAIGPSQVASRLQITRVTLYRMLSKGGNPRLKSLVELIRCLELKIWVVEQGF